MHIAMIGCGYVGLVSGTCFADCGHLVTCVDTDPDKIASLLRGQMPIFEPGLAELVAKNTRAQRLSFTSRLAGPAKAAEAIFIAVGTPSRRGDGHADLSYVFDVAREIAAHLDGYKVIVTKSTVPVGTGDEVARIIAETRPGAEFSVVSNPEFLREGAAISDFNRPDRIVVGVEDARARQVMTDIYQPLSRNQVPLLFTSRRTAELIKYAANAFLATKITFINEMAELCERTGADVEEVARGIGMDSRIGRKFLHAGPGFGGSCFPKDLRALVRTAHDFGAPCRIVEVAAAVNDQRKRAMGLKVVAACGGNVRGRTIAVLGLTFKPDTDDMREAPSIALITALQDAGARVRAFDPKGMAQARTQLDNVDYAKDPYACAADAEALVVVTDWDEFRALDLPRIKSLLKRPIVVDLRNIYSPEEMAHHGFSYFGVGRGGARTPGAAG
jgi:UDPglucose 6-dehydrogenase